ncbi:MAG: hypothetical protein AB7S77_00470 [Desulfatirhabdiaceae bacterium]
MKKRVWITLLEKNEDLGRVIFEEMARYGLDPAGHFWEDDLANMAWAGPIPDLVKPDCSVWVIVGQASRFADPITRQGLGLLALAVRSAHGHNFPILISPSGGKVDVNALPTPLLGAESVPSGLGVKAVTRASGIRPKDSADYRLDVHPLPGLGLWFEIGPGRDPWKGAFLGCFGPSGIAPDAHGVGLAGTVPQNATLHYPVRGMKLAVSDREYVAWGVANDLSPAESYYARVTGAPHSLVFGPFPDGDDAEVFSVTLV